MNAVLGHFRPGAAGFDVMHFNLHKTFSTPHGGGGPGAGPIAVSEHAGAVPAPPARRRRGGRQLPPGARRRTAHVDRPHARLPGQHAASSCGPTPTSWPTAAAACGRSATTPCWPPTTSASRVGEAYELPFAGPCKHEFVASARAIKAATGVRTLDIAKRLIDHGYHPPTIYFPLIVEECLLIEPTETESIETLDAFADALIAVAAEAHEDPERLLTAPHEAPGPPPRRGDGGPPARPALAAHDRAAAALPAVRRRATTASAWSWVSCPAMASPSCPA